MTDAAPTLLQPHHHDHGHGQAAHMHAPHTHARHAHEHAAAPAPAGGFSLLALSGLARLGLALPPIGALWLLMLWARHG